MVSEAVDGEFKSYVEDQDKIIDKVKAPNGVKNLAEL